MDIFFFFFGGGGGRGGHYEIRLFFFFFFFFFGGRGGVSFLYIIGRFKVKIQNGIFFWAANFQIFLGIPDIPDFFFFFLRWGWGGVGGGWVNNRCWVEAYV